MTTTAMTLSDPIQPTTLAELQTFAQHAAKSNLCGMTESQALILAMRGRDLGFSYSQALAAFHVIKGKPVLSADAMVAVCLQSGECEYFQAVEQTNTRAVWEAKRKGRPAARYEFTIEDAKAADLMSDMYRKHPKRMLSARAKAYLARDLFPELLMGLVDEDEAREIAENRSAPRTYDAVPATIAVPTPSHVEAVADAVTEPDWVSQAVEAEATIKAAQTLADIDAAKAVVSRLVPKASPHRAAIVKLLADRRTEIVEGMPEEMAAQ